MSSLTDSKGNKELNPFIFPSETDLRFLLLVMAMAGSIFILVDALASRFFRQNLVATFLFDLIITIGLFVWTYYQASHEATHRIEESCWKLFRLKVKEEENPSESKSLHQMENCIELTLLKLPGLNSESFQLVWDEISPSSQSPSGVAFGFGQNHYVCLRQGLHDAFLTQYKIFQGVLLHEFAHIVNRDLSKTLFSIVLGRCFFPIAVTIVLLLNSYLVWATLIDWRDGASLTEEWVGAKLFLGINFRVILLLAFIEVARSSILRVREYYADARARQWLGTTAPLKDFFVISSQYSNKSRFSFSDLQFQIQKGNIKKVLYQLWELIKDQFRKRFAPLHPSQKKTNCLPR